MDLLIPYLGLLYRATLELDIHPKEWQDSRTVVVRKLAKPDYSLPGTYRLIALLSMMGKILLVYMAEDITNMAKIHCLLPNNHFGCQPGRSTSDSLPYILKFIKDT